MLDRDKEVSVILARLIRARLSAEMSQEAVSEKIAIWRQSLMMVERGKQVLTMALFLDLCRIYQVEPSQMVFGLDDEWKFLQHEREMAEEASRKEKPKRKSKKQMAEELAQKAAAERGA